jgi:TIR domain
MVDVFLSYAHPDHEIAAAIMGGLSDRGVTFPIILGMRGDPDDFYRPERDAADIVLALWTKTSVQSEWMKQEIEQAIRAWAEGKLVLVKVDKTPLPPGLRDLRAIDLSASIETDKAGALDRLAAALRGLEAPVTSHWSWSGLNAPTDSTPPVDIFVSFSTKDGPLVTGVVDAMKGEGFSPWIYTRSQDADSGRYAARIVRAIKASRKVAVMCSDNAFQSDEVVREIYVAGKARKPFVAFFLDRDPDQSLPDDFEYFLSGFPFVPVHGRDEQALRGDIRRFLSA